MLPGRLCNAAGETVECFRGVCAMLLGNLCNTSSKTAVLPGSLCNTAEESVKYCHGECNAARETVQYCQGDSAMLPERLWNPAGEFVQFSWAALHSLLGNTAQPPRQECTVSPTVLHGLTGSIAQSP